MADIDPNEDVRPASLSGFLSTLAPVAIISAVYLAIFLVLRMSQRRYYAPRTYLGSLRESERSPPLPTGLLNWVGTFWKIPDVYALQHQSLDAFLYLRYLRVATVICFVGVLITWPILFPINATGTAGAEQLDILSYANIDQETQKNRYYAHALVSWAYLGFIMYMIMRECIYYINLRQAFLLSPLYSERISSRTVLFSSVPAAYLDEGKLRKVFGQSVKRVWITHDTDKVDDLVEERDKVAMRLEKAEIKLIKLANKNRQAAIKKGTATEADSAEIPLDAESGSLAARWVPAGKRPTHRLGPLGLIGKKVDTIDWCRTELERLIPAVQDVQAEYHSGAFKKIPGVFIEFRTQADAEGAAQILAHHQGLRMSPKYIGVRPGEIVWKSLSIPWWQLVVRRYVVLAFIAALIIFWAIPLGFVGVLSNINSLTKEFSWLAWINEIPAVILGVVTGLLPAVLMSILMSLVPVVMRLCAKFAGEPSLSQVELFTQSAYFAFQVIQVFLVTTLSSAATAVAKEIVDNPTSAPTILSNKLPKASNIYISYFIVQGLTIATGVLTQVVGFVVFKILYKLLATTPRAMYKKWATLSAISWGSTLPVYTNIIVIAIVYAGIAPLMLAWATIAMALFYLAWRYNIFFVTDTVIDTRGLIYPKALKQLFTGIYLAELCMIGLFGASTAAGPAILMVIFLIFTILFHITLNHALNPLLYNLPLTLLAEEESRLLDPEVAGTNGADGVSAADGEKKVASNGGSVRVQEAPKKANFLVKFLKPWIYSDYHHLRTLVPHDINFDGYPDEVARDAYYPPSVTSKAPLLWIPADAAGVSKQEIAHTSKVIPITDEGCELDEKGNMVWDTETTRPPVWEEKILY